LLWSCSSGIEAESNVSHGDFHHFKPAFSPLSRLEQSQTRKVAPKIAAIDSRDAISL
jgi:hypothetical protein